MGREVIRASEIPSSPAFSHAIRTGNLVFLSGMAAFDPLTKKVDAAGIEAQTDQAIRNCETVLRSVNTRLADVVQVTVLLRDPADFDGMNRAYLRHFPESPPARAVAKLGVELPNVLVSIMMTAVAPDPAVHGSDGERNRLTP
jgi:2-iminobutanoate/2-iminopropanoate deaminase